jgi:DNA polymerase-3 subunit gamma/tau
MLALRLLAFRPVAALDPDLRPEDISEVPQNGAGEGAEGAKKPEPPPAASDDMPWHMVLDQLKLSGSARNVASHSVLVERSTSTWCLHLDESRANLFNERHQQVLSKALSDWRGAPTSVQVTTGKVEEETPAARAARLAAERLAEAEAAIAGDPRVAKLIEDFEGRLIEGSVQVAPDA